MLLGIDGGGTKTDALLTDNEGNVLFRRIGGGSNLNDSGLGAVEEHLRALFADLPAGPIDAVYAGVAGCATSDNSQILGQCLRELLPQAKCIEVTSDMPNAYYTVDGVRDGNTSSMFYRDASRGQHGSEHTLFFHGANVEALVDRYKFRTEHESSYKTGLNFADNAVDQCTGGAAENVQVTFNTSKSTSFTYHADSGKYTAVQYKADYKDGATGEAVPFTNLLILSADMKTVDSYGRLAVDLIGSGTGYFVTGGKYVPIKWARSDINSCFTYTLEDGTALNLSRGTTYVGVIPTNGGSANFS